MKVRDVAAHVFGVLVTPSKSRKLRYVFLPDEGMAFFLNLCSGREANEYVFLHQNGASRQGRHKHLFKAAIRDAGLPDEFVFHGLRHTYANQLMQAGTPLVVIAQQLGHANTDTSRHKLGRYRSKPTLPNSTSTIPRKQKSMPNELRSLSKSLHGDDWRQYGQVGETGSWPR